MLKKPITFENPFTGMATTEEFYFHISKADIVRMQVEEHQEAFTAKDGVEYSGMQAKLMRIMEAQDGKQMMPLFEDMIKRSYGRKDGDRFTRSEEIWQDFRGSGAFDELLFELCTNAEKSAEFINKIFPSNLEQIAAELQAEAAAKPKTKPKAKPKAAAKKPAESAIEAVDRLPGGLGWGDHPEREAEVLAATVEAPVTLTNADISEMNGDDLKAGLSSGRYKLA